MNVRDWWVLKQLRAQVMTDLSDFIPAGYFQDRINRVRSEFPFRGRDEFDIEVNHDGLLPSDH